MTGNTTQVKFSLVPGAGNTFQRVLLKRKEQIFPNGASYNEEAQAAQADCIAKFVSA